MNMGFALPSLRQWHHAIGCVIVFTSSLISPTEAFGQTKSYVVTELTGEDATQVPSKLNNLGDIVGCKVGSGEGAPRATLWSHYRPKPKHLGVFFGGDYSSATGLNDAGEIAGVSNTGTALLA